MNSIYIVISKQLDYKCHQSVEVRFSNLPNDLLGQLVLEIQEFWEFFANKTLNNHTFKLRMLNLNYKFFAC